MAGGWGYCLGTKRSFFVAVATWAPWNNSSCSSTSICGAQQLTLHMKYCKYQKPVGLLS